MFDPGMLRSFIRRGIPSLSLVADAAFSARNTSSHHDDASMCLILILLSWKETNLHVVHLVDSVPMLKRFILLIVLNSDDRGSDQCACSQKAVSDMLFTSQDQKRESIRNNGYSGAEIWS